MVRVCFHIHTRYSFDSLMSPRKILKLCKKLNVERVYITDHNSIKGSLKAKRYEKEFGLEVILGTEIRTQYGDIIGVGINEDIISIDFEEVIEIIKSQDGISILPHPYRSHKKVEYLASRVDVIEIWNGHCTPEENQLALELNARLNKPPVVGSDAHVYSELGNAIMEFKTIYDKEKRFYIHYPTVIEIEMSNMIGHLKSGKFWKIPLLFIRHLTDEVRRNT